MSQSVAATESTALTASNDRTPAVITQPQQFTDALRRWEGHYHVLTPFTNISGLGQSYGLFVSQVRINPDKSFGEVYDGLPFLSAGEVSIAKNGLRKLADAMGISIETLRTDPRTIPCYWEFKAVAIYRGLDGSPVRREATKEWDLRDGSAQMKGWKAAQIEEARKHGLRNCEARAINAAIRECGIRQKYTKAELTKAFVAVRVAFQPDMSDPDIKRVVTEANLHATSALYPSRPAIAAAHVDVDVEAEAPVEPRVVGSSSAPASPAASMPETTTTSAGAADTPPSEDAVRIVDAKAVPGTSKKTGKPYTKYEITDSRGEVHSTFDAGLYDAAVKARDARAWVEVSIETQNGFKNLVEIAPAGQSPKLPDPGAL